MERGVKHHPATSAGQARFAWQLPSCAWCVKDPEHGHGDCDIGCHTTACCPSSITAARLHHSSQHLSHSYSTLSLLRVCPLPYLAYLLYGFHSLLIQPPDGLPDGTLHAWVIDSGYPEDHCQQIATKQSCSQQPWGHLFCSFISCFKPGITGGRGIVSILQSQGHPYSGSLI
jgi:hypothetical protein